MEHEQPLPASTAKSTPTVNIPSVSNIHPSNPCSLHDSICRHNENDAGARVVPKITTNMSLWLHSTCDCSCHRWAVVGRLSKLGNELLPSTPRTLLFRCQAISANPEKADRILMPSLVSTSRWDVTRRSFSHELPEQISTFASASSTHAWQTQRHPGWHGRQPRFHAKPNSTSGAANNVTVLTAAIDGSPSLCTVPRR